ncbi:MAG: homocysteine S-methyltransferase family protein [Oscillospiraceae bacterium]|jgi:5-methyltetrahydrofolate--homocysteine methyltransferase|nr:homocysteine S-methyltransferase family protein [Oscillospiraceae bacterium]
MARPRITEVLASGKLLVGDGAWGTLMLSLGLPLGECPELWNLTRFADVRDIALGYARAGADVLGTNSFGACLPALARHGLESHATEICLAAARASREAAGPAKWVAASMGPSGLLLAAEETTEDELCSAFAAQALALEAGGADAVSIETMSDVGEAAAAVRAVKDHTGLEVICSFTFDKTPKGEYRTLTGATPAQAVTAALAAGADIVGANCCKGSEQVIEVIELMSRAAPGAFLAASPNAGLPEYADGKYIYPHTPQSMARYVPSLIRAGARLVGGCCGTTPSHVTAIKAACKAYLP